MSASESRARVPDFLKKLFAMVSDPQLEAIIGWSPDGLSFEVHDVDRLEAEVLGEVFKHASMKSLHRQLNLYGFRKIGAPTSWEFSHASFVRGAPELLSKITRARATTSTVTIAKATILETEVVSLKRKRSEMEHEIDTIAAEHAEIQARLDAAESEALALRSDLEASKQATQILNVQLQSLLAFVRSSGGAAAAGASGGASADAAASGPAPAAPAGLRVDVARGAAALFSGPLSSDRPTKRAKTLVDEDFSFGLLTPRNWEELGLVFDLRHL